MPQNRFVALLVHGPKALVELVYGQVERHTGQRAKLAALGANSWIERSVSFRFAENVSIGRDVVINEGCRVWASAGARIRIGDGVMFGPNVLVLTANHGTQPGDSIRAQAQVERDTAIENGAWLGANVVVLPGVTVGAGAVVAAGAVVTADVTPEAIVGGVPARIIGNR